MGSSKAKERGAKKSIKLHELAATSKSATNGNGNGDSSKNEPVTSQEKIVRSTQHNSRFNRAFAHTFDGVMDLWGQLKESFTAIKGTPKREGENVVVTGGFPSIRLPKPIEDQWDKVLGLYKQVTAAYRAKNQDASVEGPSQELVHEFIEQGKQVGKSLDFRLRAHLLKLASSTEITMQWISEIDPAFWYTVRADIERRQRNFDQKFMPPDNGFFFPNMTISALLAWTEHVKEIEKNFEDELKARQIDEVRKAVEEKSAAGLEEADLFEQM